MTMTGFQALNYLISGVVPPRFANSSRDTVPTAAFETADRPLYVAYANDRTCQRLVTQALGRPDLAEQADFVTAKVRVENRDRLLALIGASSVPIFGPTGCRSYRPPASPPADQRSCRSVWFGRDEGAWPR
ncbi:MAG: CoA transferase [Acetobacteraceae bacterium]|nr:CoA transferase [Acetobacteraceae bacterium]